MLVVPMQVTLLEHMGSDLSVVNAARVSFDKESEWYDCPFEGLMLGELKFADEKLISYLAKHNHWSPFSHSMASFRIKAPIFVARQLQKHTVGLAWNEVSRRYVDSEPEFFMPEVWRGKAESVKQGSSDTEVDLFVAWDKDISMRFKLPNTVMETCLTHYTHLLELGVCPEQARMVLPQSTMTEWIWSGSLYAFARVCNLRLDSHTQQETQAVAKSISIEMHDLFPVSWEALVTNV